MQPLQKAAQDWDGKSAQAIEQVFQQFAAQPGFIQDLMSLILIADCQKAATWLLKKWLASHKHLAQTHVNQLLSNLSQLSDWESKLHMLQCLSFFTISPEYSASVEQFLRITLADNNKFVRAWAYNGFYVLAKQYPAYQAETQTLFEMAMRDEPASIQARIRQVMKAGF